MTHYKVFENDDDWKQFRAGLFTASEIYRLMTEPKKKDEVLSVGAKTYITEKVAELIAPLEPSYYNSAMEHGNEKEPMAVLRIAQEIGKNIDDDDFIYTSSGGWVFFYDDELDLGGTPDVIIKNQMICEVKAPLSKTHLTYLMLETPEDVLREVPQYYGQMQLNMLLTGTDQCLFVSFDDRFYNPEHHYHSVMIPKNEAYLERLKIKAKHAKEMKLKMLKTLGYENK